MTKKVQIRQHRRQHFNIWRSGLPVDVQRQLYKKELTREFDKDPLDWRAIKYLQRGLRMCEAQMKTNGERIK